MPQFMIYGNPNPRSKKIFPYLLDVQTDLLDDLRTTVVIPLCEAQHAEQAAIDKLCPTLEIEGSAYVALTQQIAGIEKKHLGKEISSGSAYRTEILAALDFLLSGI